MTEIRKSADPGRCCWHCRCYIRPIPLEDLLDGLVAHVCTVGRLPDPYLKPDHWHQGYKDVLPDNYCDSFKIDPPPKWIDD